jgi:hypothetical protein
VDRALSTRAATIRSSSSSKVTTAYCHCRAAAG